MERGLTAAAVGTVVATGGVEAGVGLRARAAELADRYDELFARADAAAARWRWATPTSGYGDVEPLRLERMGCSPGTWLHRPPPPWREHEAIGYDALGRVVWVREYDATGEVWLERFARWTRDAVEVACFRAPLECAGESLPAKLQAVVSLRLSGGLPAQSERLLPPTGSRVRERYRHEGGRLVEVEEDSRDEDGGLITVVKQVLYDADGGVAGIDRLGPDGRRPVWRRDEAPRVARRNGSRPATGRFRRQVCV
jgi:hypothetical protein